MGRDSISWAVTSPIWIPMSRMHHDEAGRDRRDVNFLFSSRLILQIVDTSPSRCPLGSLDCHLGF